MIVKPPEDLDELLATAGRLRHAVRAVRHEASSAGNATAELIACAYSFAGSPDPEANARGAHVLRDLDCILEALAQIDQSLARVQSRTRLATAAVDDARARRRQAARKLSI